jgi:DHA3 family macrolide efflux protein-like MFS transporter
MSNSNELKIDIKNDKNIQNFFVLWFGQVVSIIGSGLTGFALGVYVYQQTGSAVLYSLIILATTLPGILVRPFSGVIADRFDRRRLIFVSDFLSGMCTLFVAIMLLVGKLEIWHIFLAMGLSSVFTGFQSPAYSAGITQLVPKEFYAQASGLTQMATVGRYLVSPILAGVLMGVIGIYGVIFIDFATFLFAVAATWIIKIPRAVKTEIGEKDKGKMLKEIKNAIVYLRKQSGLISLILILAVINFFFGAVISVIGPMILSFSTAMWMGIGTSICALGMFVSTMIVSTKGIPKDSIKVLSIALAIGGICYAFMGVSASLWIVIPCFLFFVTLPFCNTSIEMIMRKKVVPDMQGRVFALMEMVVQCGEVLAYLVCGFLAEIVFEPLLATGGFFADTIGRVIGTGPGRGIGLMVIISGLVISMVLVLVPKIRRIETRLPDVEVVQPLPQAD